MSATAPRGASGFERALAGTFSTARKTLDRVGVRSAFGRDAVGALLWLVVTALLLYPILGPLAGFLGLGVSTATTGFVLGVITVQTLLLAVRRTSPVLCLVIVSVLQVVLVTGLPSGVSVYGPAGFVAAYTVGTLLPPRRLLWTVGVILTLQAVAVTVATLSLGPRLRDALGSMPAVTPALPTSLVIVEPVLSAAATIMVGVAASATGAWVALRRDQIATMAARAAATVEEQRVRAAAAITAERSRMARELHDIAAHHLSGLVVQAGAAERLVDIDPESAKETIRSLRTQGRKTLDNLRTAVGVLRDTGALPERADDAGAPVPGLAVLKGLLQEARDAGDHVELEINGEPYDLPPIADVTAYRIIQESVANARRHATGAPVRVVVDYTREGVRLIVMNQPSGSAAPVRSTPSGFGLLGMRERTALVGGSLEVGPMLDGGWRVSAVLPTADADRGGT